MKTYQDYLTSRDHGSVLDFIKDAITEYRSSTEYKIACDADEYEKENNITIMEFMRLIFTRDGEQVVDFTSANNKIASNFFHRLTTQRVAYSLGNGISFANAEKVFDKEKKNWIITDHTKEKLGKDFDTVLYSAGRFARLHRVSYLFWNLDHADLFKATEFCPLFDENNGGLGAGMRFWSLNWDKKPVTVVFYEQDGYTKYRTKKGSTGLDLEEIEPKRAYKQKIAHNNVDPDEIVGESNYSYIPIIPFWGSEHRQSDLVGMRSKIDAYDLVKSGFCNDLDDCSEVFFIINNALGMTEEDLAKFRDRLKLQHIAAMDTDNTNITPYTQEIPTQARAVLLDSLRAQIYEDYGGLDVHTIAAGSTNDHIDAAYQPMDEEADDFEYQCIEAIRGILNIIGIDDMPIFQRNRISNRMEQTQMVMMAANYLDEETILRKLPFITPDEVDSIIARKMIADQAFIQAEKEQEEQEEEEEETEEEGV